MDALETCIHWMVRLLRNFMSDNLLSPVREILTYLGNFRPDSASGTEVGPLITLISVVTPWALHTYQQHVRGTQNVNARCGNGSIVNTTVYAPRKLDFGLRQSSLLYFREWLSSISISFLCGGFAWFSASDERETQLLLINPRRSDNNARNASTRNNIAKVAWLSFVISHSHRHLIVPHHSIDSTLQRVLLLYLTEILYSLAVTPLHSFVNQEQRDKDENPLPISSSREIINPHYSTLARVETVLVE